METCSFCGMAQSEVGKLFTGQLGGYHICDLCVETFHDSFEAEGPDREPVALAFPGDIYDAIAATVAEKVSFTDTPGPLGRLSTRMTRSNMRRSACRQLGAAVAKSAVKLAFEGSLDDFTDDSDESVHGAALKIVAEVDLQRGLFMSMGLADNQATRQMLVPVAEFVWKAMRSGAASWGER